MKKDGCAESTIKTTGKRLRMMARVVNLDDPDEAKEYIAEKNVSSGYKEASARAACTLGGAPDIRTQFSYPLLK